MSTYYIPPRHQSQSDASYLSSNTPVTAGPPREQREDLQLEESIYIFPTPSSTPASPSGSSAFSAPTDFTDSISLSTGTRSRDQSFSSSVPRRSPSPQYRSRRRGTATGSATRTQSRARSYETDEYDLEVEYWDWAAESGEDIPDDDGIWEFEAELERASRWDLPARLVRRLSPLRPLGSGSNAPTADFYEQHYRIFLRARTQSNTSSLSTGSSLSSKLDPAPHPRIHIPLLSFFASLLSLNLDDPALRLLTHSSTDTILFPGQRSLLSEGASATWDPPSDNKADSPKAHGLVRLRHVDDGSRPPDRTLMDGLAVACDKSKLPNPFSLPGFTALAGLCRFVGGVWTNSGKAWQEVQDAGSLPVS